MVRLVGFFFFEQKTSYEMRISDWSSYVCSSDLRRRLHQLVDHEGGLGRAGREDAADIHHHQLGAEAPPHHRILLGGMAGVARKIDRQAVAELHHIAARGARSEEHTSELQSLMRISYAVFCLKKTSTKKTDTRHDLN